MQLSAPQPRRHKVLMLFRYWSAWDVIFFDTDRMRTALPRSARFNSDEVMIEFARRAGGLRTSEDRSIFDLMIQSKSGEITLELTDGRNSPNSSPASLKSAPRTNLETAYSRVRHNRSIHPRYEGYLAQRTISLLLQTPCSATLR
jgi:hypothetical protein